MSRVKVIVYTDWDPDGTGVGADLPETATEIDIEVAPGQEPVIITVTADAVSMNTRVEPRLVVVAGG